MSFYEVNNIFYLNIEVTTKCSLKCPMCPRTVFPDFINLKHEMPLDFIPKIKQFKNLKKIYICGANGEPTQHSKFHEILLEFKKNTDAQINFHTHGCFKSEKWWDKTLSILSKEDHIIFSIDGLEDTNHIYRINSKWKQIEVAAKMATKKVLTTWKYIIFSHNEHQIQEAIHTAKDWGFTWFSLKKSDRWNNAYIPDDKLKDWMLHLRPSEGNYTADSFDPETGYSQKHKFNSAGNFRL